MKKLVLLFSLINFVAFAQHSNREALDSLKHELSEIEKAYPEIIVPDSPSQRVAGKPLPQFKKVRHEIEQWSFNDCFTPEEFKEFDARVKRFLGGATPTYVCELKIDGLKIVFTYEKGLLKTAATRGDRYRGILQRRWSARVAR